MSEQEKKVDIDYTASKVPVTARRSLLTMFMIMLGFTFFSASMWVGQNLSNGLDFPGFLGALVVGGIYFFLCQYVGWSGTC